MSERRTASIVAVLGAAILFGTTGTAQALGPEDATPTAVGTVRVLIGAATLWILARSIPTRAVLRAHWRPIAIGAFGVALYQPAFFTGTDRLGVALGTIVALGSGPAFTGAIEWIGGQRPPARWFGATALAIGGGTLLVFSSQSGASFSVVGLFAALGAGLGYAIYALATKRLIDRGVESTQALAWQFTLGAIALCPLLAGESLAWLATPAGIVMELHLGVLTVGVAYLLFGWGLRHIPTSTATTLTLAEPVTASIAAFVVLDERLGAAGWLGAAIVVAALALTSVAPRDHDTRT